MKFGICLLLSIIFLNASAQTDLRYKENQTLTYDEIIKAYKSLSQNNTGANLVKVGKTDSGRDLHLLLLSADKDLEFEDIEKAKENKTVILINNGIHAGESCGIDASILYTKHLLKKGIPDNLLIAIVPVYNVGGVLNRNCCTRANQDGPEEHGFRGNARNLDLNRDFIKADALNTHSFYKIFHTLTPHIFVDTHTSNGADYQYTLTLISTQKDKLNPALATYLTDSLEPALYSGMKETNWEMIPYVNVYGNNTPDKGYSAFLETPRYASGYTTLFNTIGFITETHMLKPYPDRVESTYEFLKLITSYCSWNSDEIQEAKKKAELRDKEAKTFELNWKLDRDFSRKLEFKGYEYSFLESDISGAKRLKYHRDKPKTYMVDYYDTYKSDIMCIVPEYYVVPAAWKEVISLLDLNNVTMQKIQSDSIIKVETKYITEFKFSDRPYEGHFPLREMNTKTEKQERMFLKGDFLIKTNQKNRRFLVSVLEAEAVDSYLRWNFYDEIFQQKEGYSSYVYEDSAKELLENDAELKKKFEEWKAQNPEAGGGAQLYFIYTNSEAYEKSHLRYPVAKIPYK